MAAFKIWCRGNRLDYLAVNDETTDCAKSNVDSGREIKDVKARPPEEKMTWHKTGPSHVYSEN